MTAHRTEDPGRDALGAELEQEAELHTGFLGEAARWLAELLGPDERGAAAVRRVLDAGCGPGAASCALARAFPRAEVVAVDESPGLLARTLHRAGEHGVGARITTRRAELPGGYDRLGPADVIWTGDAVPRLGDQQAALKALAAVLRPGGLLAVADPVLPPRFLPRDIGLGRPGLQARLDAASEDHAAALRARLPGATSVVDDWPALLACAGLVPTGTRTFLIDLPAPLDLPARRHLHARLSRLLGALGDRLDLADRLTVEQLLDGDACTSILWRPDAFYVAAVTVHTARLCAGA